MIHPIPIETIKKIAKVNDEGIIIFNSSVKDSNLEYSEDPQQQAAIDIEKIDITGKPSNRTNYYENPGNLDSVSKQK